MAISTGPESKLVGWKEIAAYLKRTPRTAQRFEQLGLPIRRIPGSKSVWTTKFLVDQWVEVQGERTRRPRAQSIGGELRAPASASNPARPVKLARIAILAVGIIVLIVAVFTVTFFRGVSPVLVIEGDDFDRLLIAYNLRHEVLSRNCYLQAELIIISLSLIVLLRTDKTRKSAIGISASASWLFFIIVPVLFYLWIEFGFALDDLIKYRAGAWQYLSTIADLHGPALSRRAALFNDSGFMDGWFICFRPRQHVISSSFFPGAAFFFYLIFGTLFSLNHACIVVGLRVGISGLFAKTRSLSPRFPALLKLIPWFASLVILLSHLQFRYGGNEPNWIQPVIGVGTIVVSWMLSRVTQMTDQTGAY